MSKRILLGHGLSLMLLALTVVSVQAQTPANTQSAAALISTRAASAACPFPGPNEAVFYQHANRGGQCVVLGVGQYATPPFGAVGNDSISSLDVGSNVRVVLASNSNFWGNWAHYEGGWFYGKVGSAVNDSASSIMVRPRLGGPAATWYLYNYPYARENWWSEHAQGITHTSDAWIITTTNAMYFVPLWWDLNYSNPPYSPIGLPANFNHFGDPDVAGNFVFVPLEGAGGPSVGVWRLSDWAFMGTALLMSNSGAGWLAINPATNELWTSGSRISGNSDRLHRYAINWSGINASLPIQLTPLPDGPVLTDYFGYATSIRTVQGGDFNDSGTLLYISNGYCDTDVGSSLRVFDVSTGIMQAKSSENYGPFNFQVDPPDAEFCSGDEPEGIDYFDIPASGITIPGPSGRALAGQLHVVMIDSDAGADDLYFKHYEF